MRVVGRLDLIKCGYNFNFGSYCFDVDKTHANVYCLTSKLVFALYLVVNSVYRAGGYPIYNALFFH